MFVNDLMKVCDGRTSVCAGGRWTGEEKEGEEKEGEEKEVEEKEVEEVRRSCGVTWAPEFAFPFLPVWIRAPGSVLVQRSLPRQVPEGARSEWNNQAVAG